MYPAVSKKQQQLLNNGWRAYVKRLVIMGAIGGLLLGVILAVAYYKNNLQFSPGKSITGKITASLLIPTTGFALLGFFVGNRGWLHLNRTIWKTIAADLVFDKTTTQDVAVLFGQPSKIETKNDAAYHYYYNTRHPIHEVTLSDLKFSFVNGVLVAYVKLS